MSLPGSRKSLQVAKRDDERSSGGVGDCLFSAPRCRHEPHFAPYSMQSTKLSNALVSLLLCTILAYYCKYDKRDVSVCGWGFDTKMTRLITHLLAGFHSRGGARAGARINPKVTAYIQRAVSSTGRCHFYGQHISNGGWASHLGSLRG